jgi:signal transduction histidine kinase
MAQGTNLSRETEILEGSQAARGPHTGLSTEKQTSSLLTPATRTQGIRTHTLLVLAMALVTVLVTSIFLILLRHRLRAQANEDLSQDLAHSVMTFESLQAERMAALDRENALLAELPTLKALMTSGDDLTIQDGAVEFWRLSGDDLFALADPSGRVVAVYTGNGSPRALLSEALKRLLVSSDRHYLLAGNSLFACSVRPLYFGNEEEGTLLGYVVSGVSIERTVRQISEPTGVESAFLSNGHVVASTLDAATQSNLSDPSLLSATPRAPIEVKLGPTRYLVATEILSDSATSPLQLVLLKSLEPEELWIARMDRMVLSTGLLAFLCGTVLMLTLARLLTHPLEELSHSVRAFAMGDSGYRIPANGTQEVRQLSEAFGSMRDEIQEKNRALLESERLATIGRMASSVSHDLRHYLAAVYANSEFLASGRLSETERNEIFGEIRAAVLGTTDMIEALLIFSRTGSSVRRSPELMSAILDRAVGLVRAHPDAEGVRLTVNYGDPAGTTAQLDGKQIERAVYNLLLNACQAARMNPLDPQVTVTLNVDGQDMLLYVADNGRGVPEAIRESLFQPFVSEGKQKGTGLGLTLAHCIAEEHGGEVILAVSRPGETIFQMRVTREMSAGDERSAPEPPRSDKVDTHEKVWT